MVKDKITPVRLNDKMKDALRKYAKLEAMNISELIRDAIRARLERLEKKYQNSIDSDA